MGTDVGGGVGVSVGVSVGMIVAVGACLGKCVGDGIMAGRGVGLLGTSGAVVLMTLLSPLDTITVLPDTVFSTVASPLESPEDTSATMPTIATRAIVIKANI